MAELDKRIKRFLENRRRSDGLKAHFFMARHRKALQADFENFDFALRRAMDALGVVRPHQIAQLRGKIGVKGDIGFTVPGKP